MTMKNKGSIFLSTAITLLPIALYLLVYHQLPEQMGMQYNAEGAANWYAPKAVAVFVVPAVLALIHLFALVKMRTDPNRKNISVAMQIIKEWTIPAASILITVYSILQNTGTHIGNIVPLVTIGFILLLIGNYIPKTHQNFTIGIRTPWTLKNAVNWNKVNRLAGWLWIISGVILILSAFIVTSTIEILMVVLLIVVLMIVPPIIYSYVLQKKHGSNLQN